MLVAKTDKKNSEKVTVIVDIEMFKFINQNLPWSAETIEEFAQEAVVRHFERYAALAIKASEKKTK